MPESIIIENPISVSHLERWDKSLPPDRRHYGVKILFAGSEDKAQRDALYRIGVRHILVSYFYLKRWLDTAPLGEIEDDLGRFDFVFLDSGAFTLMEMGNQGKEVENVKDYAEHYLESLKRIKHVFAACAEVDVAAELSREEMEDFKDRALAAGIPILPVIHEGNKKHHLEEWGWFDKFPYMGFASLMIGRGKHKGDLLEIIQEGKRRGNIFHGLGATSEEVIRRSAFYSVDSTTWLNGAKYGATQVFQNGRIRHYDHLNKGVRKQFKRRFEEAGLRWDAIEKEDVLEINTMNGLAWAQLSDYNKYSTQRSYWLTPEEQDAALTMKAKAYTSEGLIDRAASIARVEARRLSAVTNADFDDRAHEILHCSTCHLEAKCPRYKQGEACGFDINVRLESSGDIQKSLQVLLEAQYGRVMSGVLFEKVEGGVLDKNLTAEMRAYLNMVAQVKDLFRPRVEEELTIKAKGSKAGAVSSMLASVFTPTGSGGSGSGSTQTQRAAARVEEPKTIDVPSE